MLSSPSGCSGVDLYEVIRIEYSHMTRACVIYPDVEPWLTFSVYTSRRSYDFICPDERTVRAFVLTLSRLCPWAPGRVPTRSRFVALKGWCKVQEHCIKEKKSLVQLLLEAVRSAEPTMRHSSSTGGE